VAIAASYRSIIGLLRGCSVVGASSARAGRVPGLRWWYGRWPCLALGSEPRRASHVAFPSLYGYPFLWGWATGRASTGKSSGDALRGLNPAAGPPRRIGWRGQLDGEPQRRVERPADARVALSALGDPLRA
jgi:hypothetical protein